MNIEFIITNLARDIREREAKHQIKMNPRSTGYMEDDERLVFITTRECERLHLRQLQQILDQLLMIDGAMQKSVTTEPVAVALETAISVDSFFKN